MTKLQSPHLLLAAQNPRKLRENLAHLISRPSLRRLDAEMNRNVVALFRLGESHFLFARSQGSAEWRQKTSRLYYGAYNVQRAVRLKFDGWFSTDSTDHKQIGQLPPDFPRRATYGQQLPTLREDRNISDYSHDATVADLVIPLPDSEQLVSSFISDAQMFLRERGVVL